MYESYMSIRRTRRGSFMLRSFVDAIIDIVFIFHFQIRCEGGIVYFSWEIEEVAARKMAEKGKTIQL